MAITLSLSIRTIGVPPETFELEARDGHRMARLTGGLSYSEAPSVVEGPLPERWTEPDEPMTEAEREAVHAALLGELDRFFSRQWRWA